MYTKYFALVDIDSTWIWHWLAEVRQATMPPRRKKGISPLKRKESVEKIDSDASSETETEPESDSSQVKEQSRRGEKRDSSAGEARRKGKLAAGKISPRGENILPAAKGNLVSMGHQVVEITSSDSEAEESVSAEQGDESEGCEEPSDDGEPWKDVVKKKRTPKKSGSQKTRSQKRPGFFYDNYV